MEAEGVTVGNDINHLLEKLRNTLLPLLESHKVVYFGEDKFILYLESNQYDNGHLSIRSVNLEAFLNILGFYYLLTKKNIEIDRFGTFVIPDEFEMQGVFETYLKFLKTKKKLDIDQKNFLKLISEYIKVLDNMLYISINYSPESEVTVHFSHELGRLTYRAEERNSTALVEFRKYLLNIVKGSFSNYKFSGGTRNHIRVELPTVYVTKKQKGMIKFVKYFFPNLEESDIIHISRDMPDGIPVIPIVRFKSEVLDRTDVALES